MMPKQWKAKVRQAEKGKHSRWRERHRQRRSKNENVSMKPEQPRGRRVSGRLGAGQTGTWSLRRGSSTPQVLEEERAEGF